MENSEYYDMGCPKCIEEGRDSAEDNLRVYKNTGLGHCLAGHGCVGKVNKEQIIKEEVAPKLALTVKKGKFIDGEYLALPSRKITQKTCEYYGYQVNKAKKAHIANYYDINRNLVMQQLRTTEKDFPIIGDKSFNNTLYGSWLWTPSDKVFITITEGQIDCLSVAQLFELRFPVVSIPNGVNSAAKVLQENMPYLMGFKYVVILFDNDKAGREATEACLKLFEPGKIRVAHTPLKDANEMLVAGLEDELRRVIFNAKAYLPAPILTGADLLATLTSHVRKIKEWPWPMANAVIQPIYTPAVYTFAALPGVGKTVVMGDIMRSIIKEGGKVGVISLEESTPSLILKLSDVVLGTNLRSIGNRNLTKEEIESAKPITDAIVTFNHREYGSNVLTILENLPYIAQALKCEFIIFDNLSFATTGCAEDERRNLDKAMLDLKDSSTKYNYTLFNICHLNDDKDDFREASMRGSRGMMMYSDQVIYLGRNPESLDPGDRNTLTFYVKKDREFGTDTGKSFELYYDPLTKRFID